MTDDELGRQWCSATGRDPDHRPWHQRPDHPWRWANDDGPTYALPSVVYNALVAHRHATEADAYAAVGAALRELQQRAVEIAEVLKGVPQ